MRDIHAVFNRRCELHRILPETAITTDGHDFSALISLLILRRRPCAHSRWE